MKKQTIFLLIIFIAFILFSGATVLAATAPMSIKQAITKTFNWGLAMAGVLTAASFAFGAVQYIYSDHANGKDRMLGSVLGLVLIFGSWIILQTINPKITTLTLGKLNPVGVSVDFWKRVPDPEHPDIYSPAPNNIPDISDVVKQGFINIGYRCFLKDKDGNYIKQPRLLIWVYDKPNFESNNGGLANKFYMKSCQGGLDLPSSGSIRWAFETPGVYFYNGKACEGDGVSSEAFTTSQSPIPEPFYGKIGSFVIVNDQETTQVGDTIGAGTGVILHQNPKLSEGGLCNNESTYYANFKFGPSGCLKVDANLSVHAADIFYIPLDLKYSGTGVNFYSNATGWQLDKGAGKIEYDAEKVLDVRDKKASSMIFDWKEVYGKFAGDCSQPIPSNPSDDPCPCRTFRDCPGSIQVNGDYLVMLSQHTARDKTWCQTFRGNVDNLGTKSFLIDNTDSFHVTVIPTTH